MSTTTDEAMASDFREWYEEFSDSTTYKTRDVRKALKKALFYTGGSRWGVYKFDMNTEEMASLKAMATFAYAAHILSINKAAKVTTSKGQIASAVMPVASRSVAGESVSFASSGAPRGGHEAMLNSTVYGQEFLGYLESVKGPMVV